MTKRLQIDISAEGFERLKSLKEKTEASSYADVTCKAYRLYEYILKAIEEGNQVVTMDVNGVQTEIKLL